MSAGQQQKLCSMSVVCSLSLFYLLWSNFEIRNVKGIKHYSDDGCQDSRKVDKKKVGK